jgi:hypothetical protein
MLLLVNYPVSGYILRITETQIFICSDKDTRVMTFTYVEEQMEVNENKNISKYLPPASQY